MPEEPTSRWPVVRINPDVKSQLEALIDERLPGAPLLQVVHAILSGAVHQINGTKPGELALSMLQRLKLEMRHPTGSYVAEGGDLAAQVMAHERRLGTMAQALEKLAAAAEEHTAAQASSKKKQAARPKRAA